MAKIKETTIDQLVPDDKNLNKGTEYGKALLDKSFSKFGAGRSILIDKNNRIIAGNKASESFGESGGEKVVVVETEGDVLVAVKRTDIDLDSKEGRELALADNATQKADLDWDRGMLDEVAAEWDIDAGEWGVKSDWDDTPSPDSLGEDFALPDGDKAPFRQISFQLSNEMADVLLLATKAAQYSDAFYEIAGDGEDVNANGVAAYILAKEWCDKYVTGFDEDGYEESKKKVEELRNYLRDSLYQSGKRAADVDELLGTSGMSGHYFGSSQWMFPTKKAYEKMREIMPLPRDYFECKKIEMRYNLFETLKEYSEKWEGQKK